MSLLNNIVVLLNRCEMHQRRCDIAVFQIKQKEQKLDKKLEEIELKRKHLKTLLYLQKPEGKMNKTGLYAIQRRLAIVRRQLTELDLKEVTIQEKKMEYQKEKEKVMQERQYWLRKSDKYQHWQKVQKKLRLMAQLKQEETEMEEIITCKKK
ncbi:hypothetical protein [Candidatus Williamhamiltonella defendens]|uniref:Type III needle complex assembly protein n=1 Tax=Candidatus Hamiltonella defensa (Bemisia tabaci) TaxID=672795 RepID=A0A249DZB2_9ENTR|nr:hypothetical protein [Candidatus Hamiltonella defensa]ASX26883.1 type III needle complex assembly protein [Candidatus Hamiltonella defensa (Bemisia tabaci)]CED79708.1 Surface presentation of antigens protein SpaM [Candidatus Hamiltonella defensa (Bemisia tabaci)]